VSPLASLVASDGGGACFGRGACWMDVSDPSNQTAGVAANDAGNDNTLGVALVCVP